MSRDAVELPDRYLGLLAELGDRVRVAQARAVRTVNRELIALYWEIGHAIVVEQQYQPWGSGVIGQLADDLRLAFPTMTGLSRSNLQYMRAFATQWPDSSNVPQAVGHLPWGHIRVLFDKLDDRADRELYAAKAAEHGWSRDVLLNHIKNRTLERTGAAPSNFDVRLPLTDSALARDLAKDPYVFDFLDIAEGAAEREFEQALMDRISQTLAELGAGFAFVGRQVHFEVDGDDFYVDLLFFHVEQLRYVVVELKKGRFEPAFAGQLGFYVAIVDDKLRRANHAPTVGILICGDKSAQTVRYALGQTTSPMAVSTYTYDSLPADEKLSMPSAAQLIAALDEN
ncbi:PDDEXK nuclease domain-containing protein [Subtercola sp. YIM 133946]|uniref:PDDEXK nuclease domain-containing protein n=1 Tax=Subtercola sp. YIM 133946 TaxID=3118909 RepID=UPI002F95316C